MKLILELAFILVEHAFKNMKGCGGDGKKVTHLLFEFMDYYLCLVTVNCTYISFKEKRTSRS